MLIPEFLCSNVPPKKLEEGLIVITEFSGWNPNLIKGIEGISLYKKPAEKGQAIINSLLRKAMFYPGLQKPPTFIYILEGGFFIQPVLCSQLEV